MIVTNTAKVETMATPVEREYSPDANGKFGLLTLYEDNKSQILPIYTHKEKKTILYSS
jgi:hypothetical protein